MEAPPYATTALRTEPLANLRASSLIWMASSLVGATTKALKEEKR